MEQSNASFIRDDEKINKEKIYKKKSKGNKSIKIFLYYVIKISILVNIIFYIYICLFQKKSSNNIEIKYIYFY